MEQDRFFNRELSWIAFNGRVLQEACDADAPLYERIKFLAIYSSNLDEFYRVRVASIRSLLSLKSKSVKTLDFDPEELLDSIQSAIEKQQEEFGAIYRDDILPELASHNIYLHTDTDIGEEQRTFVTQFFSKQLLSLIKPQFLSDPTLPPFLDNKALYLVCELEKAEPEETNLRYALVPIPTSAFPRFVQLPSKDGTHVFMFLDDVVRFSLPMLFVHYRVRGAYAVKMTRDAELLIDDEFSGNLLDKIKKALGKRWQGAPCRFLYDASTPKRVVTYLREFFSLSGKDMFRGGRYHNFNDFFSFPNPRSPELEYPFQEPLRIPELDSARSLAEAAHRADVLLYYPYHPFDYLLRFLEEAAEDPLVDRIDITLYRVANSSRVCAALMRAAENGKIVNAFVEVKARFDEESNIQWAEDLAASGVHVRYSIPGLKVHCKLCLVHRRDPDGPPIVAYLATGNFNEKTARLYTDFGLFTTDPRIAGEAAAAFAFACNLEARFEPSHLLVAQLNMRTRLNRLIKNEIKHAKKGKPARIILKVNSLEDRRIINRLYEASQAGVQVDILVRGICRLKPGVRKLSENIRAVSIVDRFLEHPRVYIFHNDGEELCYISSADWMTRNLNHRIEIAVPIYDEIAKRTIRRIIDVQWADNVKARIIDAEQTNAYRPREIDASVRSQEAIYDLLKHTGNEGVAVASETQAE